MDKLTEYPKLIKRILTECVELSDRRPQPDIETDINRIKDETLGMAENLKPLKRK